MKTITSIIALLALSLTAFAQDSTIKSWPVRAYAGVPGNGTSEIDTLTIAASTSGGTFTITIANGRTSAAISWSATNATLVANVDAALEAMTEIGTGGVTTAVGTMTAGIGTITITFAGKNARMDFPDLTITSSLTGGAAGTLTTTTAGVAATYRDAPTGTLLVDTVTPDLYINDSVTANAPTWTKVSP
jgi:hypothetical protein